VKSAAALLLFESGATSLADRRRVDDVQTGPTTVVDEEIIEDPLYDSAPGAS